MGMGFAGNPELNSNYAPKCEGWQNNQASIILVWCLAHDYCRKEIWDCTCITEYAWLDSFSCHYIWIQFHIKLQHLKQEKKMKEIYSVPVLRLAIHRNMSNNPPMLDAEAEDKFVDKVLYVHTPDLLQWPDYW